MRSKWLENFSTEDLNRLIIKKDKYIPNYLKKVDSVYLLIVEGFIPKSWYGDFENIGSLVNNRFNKIFLLRYMSRKIHVLK